MALRFSCRFIFSLIGIALFVVGCSSQTTLVNSVSEKDAIEIYVLLASKGIAVQKTPAPATTTGGSSAQQLWNISVPSSQITESLTILNQAGLPRAKGTSLLDLFGSQGLVPSDLQDRIRYQEGLSEQLATTLRKMDGVIDADVQITLPQDEDSNKPLTASVYIKHRGVFDNQNSLVITKIKRLISSAVPGLTIENVSVVTDRALYADMTIPQGDVVSQDQKDYVQIWSIVIAKESALRFRLIFYAFIIILFILACALCWILWKFYPVLEKKGGFKVLLEPSQVEYPLAETKEEVAPPSEEEEVL